MRRLVVIEMGPTRLELGVVVGARVEASRVARFSREEGDALQNAIERYEPTLREWIKELDLEGRTGVCVYRSREAFAGVSSCPASAGKGGALGAARLGVGDGVSYSVDANPLALAILTMDPPTRREDDADVRQIHTLGVADSEENVGLLAGMLQRLGLRAAWVTPSSAVQTVEAVRAARDAGPGRAVVMCVWEEETLLAGCEDGRLRFVRTIGVGTESMAGAIARIGDGEDPGADEQWARDALYRYGIPERDTVIDEQRNIRGGQVLARVAPVVQRLGVEIKQSIRFGFGEGDKPSVRLIGFGSDVPHLAEVVGEACECTVSTDPSDASSGVEPLGAERGATRLVAEGRASQGALVTRVQERRSGLARLRQATWFGVGLAALVMGWQYLDTTQQLEVRRAELAGLGEPDDDAHGAAGLRTSVVGAAAGVNAARTAMTDSLGGVVDVAAVLWALSDVTPSQVRLQSIAVSDTGDTPSCVVRGLVPGDANEASELIRAYLDGLKALPNVERVRLGATGRQSVNGVEGRRFEMTIDLVRVPSPALAGLIDGASEVAP